MSTPPPYGEPQDPHGAPGYGPPPGAGYGPPSGGYGYDQPGFVPMPPQGPPHPSAHTAMILGVVGLAGGFFCLLPIVVSPFAWAMGSRAVKEIDASQGRLSGRSDAQAGVVMGIIGTVLLGLALLGVVLFVIVFGSIFAALTDAAGSAG